MPPLPTLSTVSWESDPIRIIDARLASYMISYKLDTSYMRNGVMSLEHDISMYSNSTMRLIDAVERSITMLLKEYIGTLSVGVSIRDTESNDKFNIVVRISGNDDRGSLIDAIKLFEVVDSKVVKMSAMSQ